MHISEIKSGLGDRRLYEIFSSCMYMPTMEKYLRIISNPSVRIFVCCENSQPAGMLALRAANGGAEIVGIAVHPAHRRKGIGRRLLETAPRPLAAETDDDSVGFYRRCGFVCEPIDREFPEGTIRRYRCAFHAACLDISPPRLL